MKRLRAFTLIELLFVVAIIAVLAAIAVPNFLEAQVRSKVMRTRADMAVVAAGLRAYSADYNRYPPNLPRVRPFLRACVGVADVNTATVPTPAGVPIIWTRRIPPRSQRGTYHRAVGPAPVSMNPFVPGAPLPPGTRVVPGSPQSAGPIPGAGPGSAVTSPTRTMSRNPSPTTGTVQGGPQVPPGGYPPGMYPPGTYPPGANPFGPPGSPSLSGSPGPAAAGYPPGFPVPGGYFGYGWNGYPVLNDAGFALSALTTPVPYFTQALPVDSFSDLKTPFLYINYVDVLGKDHLVKDGGKERRYLLLSYGPDTDQRSPHFTNPLYGPFTTYDPTNGTVSEGDITLFGY